MQEWRPSSGKSGVKAAYRVSCCRSCAEREGEILRSLWLYSSLYGVREDKGEHCCLWFLCSMWLRGTCVCACVCMDACLYLLSWTTPSSLTSSEPEGPVYVRTSTSFSSVSTSVSYGFGGCNLKSTDDHYELEDCQKRITEQLFWPGLV